MTPDELNDLTRFVSQPGEMELLTPEAIMDRLDQMVAKAHEGIAAQEAVIAQCDRDLEALGKQEQELREELAQMEQEIAQTRKRESEYGRKAD